MFLSYMQTCVPSVNNELSEDVVERLGRIEFADGEFVACGRLPLDLHPPKVYFVLNERG